MGLKGEKSVREEMREEIQAQEGGLGGHGRGVNEVLTNKLNGMRERRASEAGAGRRTKSRLEADATEGGLKRRWNQAQRCKGEFDGDSDSSGDASQEEGAAGQPVTQWPFALTAGSWKDLLQEPQLSGMVCASTSSKFCSLLKWVTAIG